MAIKEFQNKKARHDYKIEESIEAGLVLTGDEIKAIRSGRVDITTSYAKIINHEVFLIGLNLVTAADKQRTRKLLLRSDQIKHLIGKVSEQGYTIIPLRLYFNRGKAKVEIGIGKGMKSYDKREILKKREQNREIDRRVKDFSH